jgi:predicted hydrocarbon binding protein
LLAKADIRALVQKKQKEAEKRLEIRRDDIIRGLLIAVQEAKEEGSPMAMIAAYQEIGKMLGYYDQSVALAPQKRDESQVRTLSDEELVSLIEKPQ